MGVHVQAYLRVQVSCVASKPSLILCLCFCCVTCVCVESHFESFGLADNL